MDLDRDPIPEEILFEILLRLPVKSLCRFRCVSKHWCSIISDPDFADAHFTCSKLLIPKLLISVIGDDRRHNMNFRRPGKICFFSVDYPEQGQPLHAIAHGSIDFEPAATISSSPSGLICFTCSDGIRIGNPITGEFDLIQTHVSHIFSEKSILGFDPIDKNYVILKLEKRSYTPGVCGKSRVFSLSENQCHDAPPHPWISAGESSVSINGVIYFTAWGGLDADVRGPCLFAFDVRTENVQMIYRPQELVYNRNFVVELVIEYKGRVALVCDGNIYDTSADKVCLWILEDSEKHTWSFQSFVIPWRENLMRDGISMDGELPHSGDRKVKLFGATHRGELVLATPLSREGFLYMFFYEVETNTLRRFEVDGFGGVYGAVRFNFVVESLQSLNSLSKKKKERHLLRQTQST